MKIVGLPTINIENVHIIGIVSFPIINGDFPWFVVNVYQVGYFRDKSKTRQFTTEIFLGALQG